MKTPKRLNPVRVWVDDAAIMYRRKHRYHLAAATVEELHAAARLLEIARCWFHFSKGSVPHYDINGRQRDRAISLGANAVTSRDLVERYRAINPAADVS